MRRVAVVPAEPSGVGDERPAGVSLRSLLRSSSGAVTISARSSLMAAVRLVMAPCRVVSSTRSASLVGIHPGCREVAAAERGAGCADGVELVVFAARVLLAGRPVDLDHPLAAGVQNPR